ncbi:multicopper oxidase family protein [Actinacidiphila glaucinigra]|uniref:Multicopper oxidase CueO n=1 Tax=Actinacidiphila glaucinigra TaxID=235986 RepID=A0A239NHE9_9ACTN|nr:multicopper oxidase domain-containing protein [Actinacidiphila glaucinigra]SNT53758.1 spore coat protein A [Actinacidiphila glaucinigra]
MSSELSRRNILGMAGAGAAAVAVAGTGILRGGVFQSEAQATEGLGGVQEPTFATLEPFRDALRVPPALRPKRHGITEIDMVESQVRLHSQMPPTRLWTYAGHFPGPTIEVRSGERVRIAWNNKLKGRTPLKAVWVNPEGPGPGTLPYNRPGDEGASPRPEVERLTAWTTVHVHGGHQNALNDGAAEFGVASGNSQLAEYANDQAATHLFYHDHAMSVTSLNVLSGLVGNYVLRDAEEDRLGLPRGEHEIPLTIQDVNFDTDDQGRLTGQVLAKRILLGGSMPMPGTIPPAGGSLGPFTMVNGVVWPYLDVQARAYRFRLVNVSGVRVYRLVVVDEETGKVVRGAMKLIGTDMGLLGKPQTIDEAISLSPAERADVVIDFAAHPGRKLKLVNTIPGQTPGAALPDFMIPFPEVMQFRVEKKRRAPQALPATLSKSFRRLTLADVPKDATERFVLLSFDKAGVMPQIWEMEQVPSGTAPGTGIVTVDMPGGTRTLRRTGSMFEDTTTFFAVAGTWEKWHFISAAPDGVPIYHPMHIHLMNFQVVDRRAVDSSGMDFATAQTKKPITLGAPVRVAPEESGWKDTITVNANTLVTVAGRLADQTGKVMYHCHILDHEDEGMMRPFVVMPSPVHDIHHMIMEMNSGSAMRHHMAKS